MAQTLTTQGVTLRGVSAIGRSARSLPKRTSAVRGRSAANQMTRASFTSGGYSPDEEALIMSAIRAGGPVVPRSEGGDPFGLLLRQRIVFLGSEVNDFTADAVISQLLLLDAQDPKKDIKLFINSPGGSVTAGMGIYDAMQMCRADVSTVCMGLAASMGAFLLTSGAKGKRLSMPNARIMIHQPLGGASGAAVDIEIQAKEIMYHKANLNRLMAFHTGQDVKQIDEDTDRDRYMSPLESKNYGIIDEIIGGDDAGLKIDGQPKEFMKTKAAYIAWGDDIETDRAKENAV
uniref:ATP-dependent Clp protease proteolytic subunit n=1 Tax=Mantoniella antarctica TaxID=81844 RepID=A0A7S0XD71_9CHLO|mmetsp:Transcript_354/g.880  ORF Transcript_354/g.880 Transcript_354/m.880 type:complete len:289 (+) Transcript_354:77-943(+)|eukprot:CAMPEP_0181364562 /NCGR_PEP_ID=MMETSP1106-20121128/9484_1 /TAXON_ID=81844 /ORGANISM="Mantoniella antarctica, Strain SL-175" /LENGTH=288 /DNA_ID=CAMNT_0023479347 /DNA_START=62 /DNA_END=928 /DNA_ORIENTATION=-